MKEVFSLFDFQGAGHVGTDDLGVVIRALGKNLTEKQIADYMNAKDADGSGKFDFSMFYSIMKDNRPMRPPPTEQEVLGFFKPFDLYNDGYISAEDLFNLLQKLGEPLPLEDVNSLLTEISIDGDQRVSIREFVRHLLASSAPDQHLPQDLLQARQALASAKAGDTDLQGNEPAS